MKYLIGIIAALLLAAPAVAQDQGFYVGGSIGQSKSKDACDQFGVAGLSCDDKDTAWKILGGYQFNRNLAVEAGYTDLGEVSLSGPGGTATAEATALELVGIGMFPIANSFSLYGKAGVYRGEVKGQLNTLLLTGSNKDTNTDATVGAGVKFDMTRNAAIRAEWQRYMDMGGTDTVESDVDVLSVGLQLKF